MCTEFSSVFLISLKSEKKYLYSLISIIISSIPDVCFRLETIPQASSHLSP